MKKVLTILGIIGLIVNFALAEKEKEEKPEDENKIKEIVVIVNAKSSLWEKIVDTKLADIYTGKVKFEGKVKLLSANHKDKEIFEAFLTKFIKKTASAYKNLWVKKVFAEGGSAPKVMDTSDAMIKYVSENEGAIGYLWGSDLTGKEEGIKIIKIGTSKEK